MKARIAHWKQIYGHDDNAITKALSQLAWDLTAFTCAVEMVRKAPDAEEGGKRLNGMILNMLATGFWANTMQGVRRLAERGSIHGPRGVCSLAGLVQDAKEARHLITRRVFVEDIAGLEYDAEAIAKRNGSTCSPSHKARLCGCLAACTHYPRANGTCRSTGSVAPAQKRDPRTT